MHPQPKSIVEIGKLFDEKFTHEQWPDLIKTGLSKEKVKQFWLEHYRSLLEEMRMEDRKLHFECFCEDCIDNAGYNERNAEINKHLDNLLSKGEI